MNRRDRHDHAPCEARTAPAGEGGMERIALKGTGLEVSRIALGTWAFDGDALWGEQGDKESIDTGAAPLDCSINFFDTAAGYAKGRPEEVLGEALVGRRDRAVIAT